MSTLDDPRPDWMVSPREFNAEYAKPAMDLWWNGNQSVVHLAIHAITQFDVLAEVTALWTLLNGRDKLSRGELKGFRDEQGQREPILALIRDLHDSHKHGRLSRQGNVLVSKGQRPRMTEHLGFFVGITALDGELTPYRAMTVVLDDGAERQVFEILYDARQAWEREFSLLRL